MMLAGCVFETPDIQGAAGEMRKMTFSDIYSINTRTTCFFTTFINNF